MSDEQFDQISLICDCEVRDFDPTVDVLVQPDECWLDLGKGRSIIWIDGIALAWYLKFIAQLLNSFDHFLLLRAFVLS